MCGIAEFVDPVGDVATLRAMTGVVSLREPDDSGYFLGNGVGLSHRRLSIIDPSDAGHQPMERDNLVIAYNGEIYNYREVRSELDLRGLNTMRDWCVGLDGYLAEVYAGYLPVTE
jgi:asparagine synthase (glutamine-hydrolysing)